MEQNEVQKREHPRYTVSKLTSMKARLDRSSSKEQLLTLGAGGCGFVGFDRAWQQSDVKRVVSVFELNLSDKIGPIQVQGNIIYAKPVTINGRSVYYFGVQFLPENAHRIQPLLDALEEMSKTGEVSVSNV